MKTRVVHFNSFGLQLFDQLLWIAWPFDVEGVMWYARRTFFGGIEEPKASFARP